MGSMTITPPLSKNAATAGPRSLERFEHGRVVVLARRADAHAPVLLIAAYRSVLDVRRHELRGSTPGAIAIFFARASSRMLATRLNDLARLLRDLRAACARARASTGSRGPARARPPRPAPEFLDRRGCRAARAEELVELLGVVSATGVIRARTLRGGRMRSAASSTSGPATRARSPPADRGAAQAERIGRAASGSRPTAKPDQRVARDPRPRPARRARSGTACAPAPSAASARAIASRPPRARRRSRA